MTANRDDVEIGVDEYNNTLKNNDDVVDIMSDLSKGVPVTQQTFDTSEEDDSCAEENTATPSSSVVATKSKKKKKYAGLAIAAAVTIGFAVAIKKSRNDNTTMSTSALEAHCQSLYVKQEVSSSTYEPTPSPVEQSVPFIFSNDIEYTLDDDEVIDDEGRELQSGKNRVSDRYLSYVHMICPFS